MAPQFERDAPVGKCEIRVQCSDGKSYRITKDLERGASEKVIVKSDDSQPRTATPHDALLGSGLSAFAGDVGDRSFTRARI